MNTPHQHPALVIDPHGPVANEDAELESAVACTRCTAVVEIDHAVIGVDGPVCPPCGEEV